MPDLCKNNISFEWCTYQTFIDNWMDKWYIVFNVPQHNNQEIQLYFLRKMYADFFGGRTLIILIYWSTGGLGWGFLNNLPMRGKYISTTQ